MHLKLPPKPLALPLLTASTNVNPAEALQLKLKSHVAVQAYMSLP
jgi:hypothetical protein